MSVKKHLFVGFGDIATRCAVQLRSQGDQVWGIARSEKVIPEGVNFWCGDAKNEALLTRIAGEKFDSAVFILTPDRYDETGYREAYFDVVDKVLTQLEAAGASSRVLFVSSSSVYAQQNGEVVDESSETNPSSVTAQVLLATEARLSTSPLETCVIRFSGIYGPGRDFLLRQVWQGKGGDERFTNRIHIDDCVGTICHLLKLDSERLQPVYLASDRTPESGRVVRNWLAEQMGIDPAALDTPTSNRQGSKKCSSDRLKTSGYVFKYPDFRDGYREVIAQFLAENSN